MMEHHKGEESGGIEPTIPDQRKEIVPGFNEEELFEFSLDQIMNGNLDERREVVEYLVDEFDEMSLAMVEGFRQFANRDAIQDHEHEDEDEDEEDEDEEDEIDSGSDSNEDDQTKQNEPEASTSKRSTKKRSVQHDDHNEDDDRNSKRAQYRHYFRTYWRKLKTNPVEYAKVLKRMSDYRKRRLEGMTDQERDKFYKLGRERQRNRYHSLSLEEKTKLNQKITEWKRKKLVESEEYREKVRRYRRKHTAKLTEEQKVKIREKNRNNHQRRKQNMTEDQRKVVRQKNAEAKRRSRAKKKNQK